MEEKIKIIPITRPGSWLAQISKNHDGLIMFSGTSTYYTVPELQDGKLVNFLKEVPVEKVDWIESELGLEKNTLNPNRQKDKNFWRKDKASRVKITKDGLTLDLNNPYDYIKYLVLKSNSEFIAPSWEKRFDKASYKFAIVGENEEVNQGSKKAEIMKDCWMQFGKIDESESKMKSLLTIYKLDTKSPDRVPDKTTKEFLRNEIGKIIETNPKKFLDIIKDPDFLLKSDIADAIKVGFLIKVGKAKYQFKDMSDETFSYEELITFLKDKTNSDRYLKLKSEIK